MHTCTDFIQIFAECLYMCNNNWLNFGGAIVCWLPSRDGVNVIDAIKCNGKVIDCKVHVIVRVIDWRLEVREM